MPLCHLRCSLGIHVEMSVDSGKCLEFRRAVTTHRQPLTFRCFLGLDKRRRLMWMVGKRVAAAKEGEQIGGGPGKGQRRLLVGETLTERGELGASRASVRGQ